MDRHELARLVEKMRAAQRSYFRSRSQGALEASKELEKRVDAAVESILNPGLFAETPPAEGSR